jgi:hypothetical protein
MSRGSGIFARYRVAEARTRTPCRKGC